MGYTKNQVADMIRQAFGGVESLAASVGQAEGGSSESQAKAARQFWQYALELVDEGQLPGVSRDYIAGQVARYEAASAPTPLVRERYGPSGTGQPV